MQPQIDAETTSILGRLSDDDCRELSRLCALIFEVEAVPASEQSA